MRLPEGAHACTIAGCELFLLPQRALWWPQAGALVVSDLHIDKAAHFRRAGIPMPGNSIDADLDRLRALIDLTAPQRVVITGDLFHSTANGESERFLAWRQSQMPVEFQLVLGNHDKKQAKSASALQPVPALRLPPFVFVHDPLEKTTHSDFRIGGHHHPGVRLGSRAGERLRFPCFALGTDFLVLPAFGRLTGHGEWMGDANVRCFAVVDGRQVMPIF